MEVIAQTPFAEIAAPLVLPAVINFFGVILRQPLVASFIAVGLAARPAALDLVRSDEQINVLSVLGIAVLLFLVGIKHDVRLVRSLGAVSLLTGRGHVALASATQLETIIARLAPLRAFLLLFFFIALGSALDLSLLGAHVVGAIVFPVIVLAIKGAIGYRKLTGFMAGLTMAQISELSLIFVATGMSLGHVHNANTAHTHIRFSRTGGHGFTSSLGYRGTLRLRC